MVLSTNIVRRELGLPEAECLAADARYLLTETKSRARGGTNRGEAVPRGDSERWCQAAVIGIMSWSALESAGKGREAMKQVTILGLGAAVLMALTAEAGAQAYPNESVKIVVPFGAGSVTDTLARALADKLGPLWKQNVIVENRPGLPGTTSVARSTADGYTLMVTSNGHVIAKTLNKNVTFDPVGDFVGITRLVEVPFVMIVPPSLPAKTLQEFVALAKKEPGKYNFSSAGVASTTFLAGETLRQAAGLQLVHLPTKGVPEAMTAVMRSDVAFWFSPIPNAIEQSKAGNVRMVAVSSPTRYKDVPDVPTVAEAGVPSFKYSSWFGLMAPKQTPKAIVDKVNADVRAVLAMPDVMKRLATLGSNPSPNSPAEFDEIIKADEIVYADLLKAAGLQAK
jgi:tripartite-type tricarboxylate transporter receptor subunit TctC